MEILGSSPSAPTKLDSLIQPMKIRLKIGILLGVLLAGLLLLGVVTFLIPQQIDQDKEGLARNWTLIIGAGFSIVIATISLMIILSISKPLEKKIEERTKELEKQKNKFDVTLESIGEGFFLVDRDRKITMWNRRAEEMTGYQEKEVLGKDCADVLKVVDEKGTNICQTRCPLIKKAFALKKIYRSKPFPLVYYFTTKEGKKVPTSATVAPILDQEENIIGGIKSFRDISEEIEVAKMKDEFLSVASHELRTPMTAIKGFLDMIIKEETGKIPTAKMKEYLNLAYEGNDRMIELVNDMLNVSRIEAGRMKFELQDSQIEELIESTIEELLEVAKSKKLFLKFKKPLKPLPKVVVARDKVRMVLTNLIGNAIKFTQKGGVEVSVEREDKNISVHIKDTGIGIAKEDQKKLFKKFSQLNSGTRTERGTGLGLYILKRIVAKLGGKVWFSSQGKGQGSTFSFSIPIKGSKTSERATAEIEREVQRVPEQK